METNEDLKRYIEKLIFELDRDTVEPTKRNTRKKDDFYKDVIQQLNSLKRDLPARTLEVMDGLTRYVSRERETTIRRDVDFMRKYSTVVERIKKISGQETTKEDVMRLAGEISEQLRKDFHSKEQIEETKNGHVQNDYLRSFERKVKDQMQEVLLSATRNGMPRDAIEYFTRKFKNILMDIQDFTMSQNKFSMDMNNTLSEGLGVKEQNLEEVIDESRMLIIQKYKNGELPVANNGQFDFYIIKEPTIDVSPFDETSKNVLEKGEICSVAAFERVYGLVEDDKTKPTTIRVEGDNLVYYMTLEENQKLLEAHKQKTGQDLSEEYGENGVRKAGNVAEKEDNAKKENKDGWDISPFD